MLKIYKSNICFHLPTQKYVLYTCENIDIFGWPLYMRHNTLFMKVLKHDKKYAHVSKLFVSFYYPTHAHPISFSSYKFKQHL